MPPPSTVRRLDRDIKADWVVVGAGVTGLAAARRLAELMPQARVVLLESYRVGYGASARNAGFIIDTPHLTEEQGDAENRCHARLVRAGARALEGRVRDSKIDCDWSPVGHLTAVVSPRRAARLEATKRMLDAVEEDWEWFDREAIARKTGTRHYHGAVFTPRSVLLNPAAMCRGLGETLPRNVALYEESPVVEVRSGSPVRVRCAQGGVEAKNVLLATNAFITELNYLRGQVFPMVGCASLSRPLTEDEQASIGGEPEWGVTGTTTMRRTRTNRMLIRHGTFYRGDFRLTDAARRRLRALHRESLGRRFPQLKNVTLEHTWAGVFCMTKNWASHFGRIEPGVFVALGYCGVGLARGTASGTLLAEYAAGSESELLGEVQAVSHPRRLPPRPVLAMGVHARLAQYRWQSRPEI